MDFIQSNKGDVAQGRKLGVEFILKVLQVAPNKYYAARDRAPLARTLSDAVWSGELHSLCGVNRKVYGVWKLWKKARRARISIGRDQTTRLMQSLGIERVKRSRTMKTTTLDPVATRHPDLVKCNVTATAPNRIWVTDLTFFPTWAGVTYVRFIIDAYSRIIIGWRIASNIKIETVLDAIEMARWSRGKHFPDCGVTRTPAVSSHPFVMGNVSQRPALFSRLGPSGTVSITLWRKQ